MIKDEDVMNILIPLFDDDIHDIVKAAMISSENLKQKSEQLLEQAKQAVEMSIEKDEQTALDWLASQEWTELPTTLLIVLLGVDGIE